ncbi:hypothetical protein BUALT_Bualt17G0076400 [Buddleja alternifolia]|uniref:Mitotic checkpoint protein BUB3.3 n=1 Tax=Buddleja alternifolia TaxID=168488 RepID=A0AAV6WFZ5_9LAMI|nr:hypothetical protein BUALT_Bualt17G0076400 [Buddleja alternifolia]
MNMSCLNLDNRIRDAISRIRFAPLSNNLLISSWDSNLRLYDVDKCELRLEAPTDGAALLDCCFETESTAVSANSDGSILRYDMHSGNSKAIGTHDDLATCVDYSKETCQIITAGWDKKVKFWDARSASSSGCLSNLDVEVESMSLSGYYLMLALRSSVHMYDLRNLDGPILKVIIGGMFLMYLIMMFIHAGFVVGSIDGRVALEYIGKSNSKDQGYAFRCHPKDKNGRHYHVAVNDIAFSPSLHGVLVTGDNEGHATIWDVLSRKRLIELPRCPNSVASLAYNCSGELLAVTSSYTYQEANEREEMPQIFIHHMDDSYIKSNSATISNGK